MRSATAEANARALKALPALWIEVEVLPPESTVQVSDVSPEVWKVLSGD